jgi:outer membrane protein
MLQIQTSVVGFVEGTNQNVLSPNLSRVLGNPATFDQFNSNKGNTWCSVKHTNFNGFARWQQCRSF